MKIEELLDCADAADKVVGEALFDQEGVPGGRDRQGLSSLGRK